MSPERPTRRRVRSPFDGRALHWFRRSSRYRRHVYDLQHLTSAYITAHEAAYDFWIQKEVTFSDPVCGLSSSAAYPAAVDATAACFVYALQDWGSSLYQV